MRDRPVRLGEVVARVRHDLRGGAAPLRRVALRVRAAVPADDGEARRRLDRRALAGDLDRPEDDLAQPALDGRHGDGDLRLPAPALRARRTAALPDLRPADRRPEPRSDRRAGARAPGGDEVHGRCADRPRAQGRVPRRPRGAPPRRVHPGQGRRRAAPARGGDRPRQEVQAHDRGRRRPPRDESRPPAAAHAVDRDRDVSRRGPRPGRRRRRRDAPLQRELRLSRARRVAARARAADLLLQRPARRVPALHGSRVAARDRPRPARPRPEPLDRGGRARPVVARRAGLLRVGHPRGGRPVRDRSLDPLARARPGGAGPLPAGDGRRPDPRDVPEPDGPQAPVHDGVRGPPHEPPAPLPRDGLGPPARADRGVHVDATVPGLPRGPPQARGARGHGRGEVDPRVLASVGDGRAPVRRRALADADGGADRAEDPEGDPRAADVPRRRRRRLPQSRPRCPNPLGRRGAEAAARDADRARSSSASSTSSTSPRSGSTSATTAG